jgi:predicted DNA-binding antitoxin AbrB/MazE fold protein
VATTIRAHIRNGRIEPLEPVQLPEGQEVQVVIPDREKNLDRFLGSFGGWKGLVDFDAFEAARRESRKLTRPEVSLQ